VTRYFGLLAVGVCALGLGVTAQTQLAMADAGLDACSSPAGPLACEGDPASPALAPIARQISVALWNARERALVRRDLAVLGEVDTGTQFLIDRFAVESAKCGCGGRYYWTKKPRPLNAVTVYVPHPTDYPLFFMAQILSGPQSENQAVTAALIITRSGPDEPWRIASEIFDTGYFPSAVAFPAPVPDPGGYDSDPQNPTAGVAAGWPASLAAYYAYLKEHRAPPANSAFLPGSLTTGTGLDTNPEGITRHGITYHYRFLVAHGPWVMNTSVGTLACADIYELTTQTPAKPSTYLFQPPDMTSWGPEIAPGVYRRIVTTLEWASCIHPTLDHLTVDGTTNALPIRQTGTRAHPKH
jgi:hypothetical protein